MKRCLLTLMIALGLVVLAVPAFAQNTSTTQMNLVGAPIFQARLQYLGWIVAQEVLIEPASAGVNGVIPAYTTACHTQRLAFARNFINQPVAGALQMAIGVVGTNVSGAVLVGSVIGPPWDSSQTDGQVSQAIRVQYNGVAGCFTNP